MKPIPSAPGYFADGYGQIWRGGRRLKGSYNRRGYLRIWVSVNGTVRTRYAHRLVCEAYKGPCPAGLECRHLNGTPDDNWPDNLEWSDKATNEADKFRHGTIIRGAKHWASALTDDQVLEARRRVAAGEDVETVAKSMGFSRPLIASAVMGRRWGHLPGALEPYSTRRRFTPDQIREIRRRAWSESQTGLAKEFGVTENAIRQIMSGKSYSHVVVSEEAQRAALLPTPKVRTG